MKLKKLFLFVLTVFGLLTFAACSDNPTPEDVAASPMVTSGKIYLFGEAHGVEKILDKEFELWNEYYHNEGMRHLFIESPYYTAEFLNLWMKADDDEILDAIDRDWAGTAAQNPYTKEFYQKIKEECPETIFHGTDVGHQYKSTGKRFLKYLEDNGLKASEQYALAKEAWEQGKYYYAKRDDVYRENEMAENFIREYEKLNGENVMGIYGSAHTGLDAMDYMTGSVPCMANQLHERYGDAVYSEDLSELAKVIEPERVDTITVNDKEYEASYFGKEDLTGYKDYTYREFWRLENAYDDLKDCRKSRSVLPYNNYPMTVEEGQVFVIDYGKTDGSVERMYFRSDGKVWDGMPSTEGFKAK